MDSSEQEDGGVSRQDRLITLLWNALTIVCAAVSGAIIGFGLVTLLQVVTELM